MFITLSRLNDFYDVPLKRNILNSFEGPVFASLAIDASPKIGGCLIAGWNVCSLILEIYLMRKIYFLIPALREPRERKKSEKPFRGIRDWASSWKLWLKSPVFWPGLALAVLYTNIFQLSFLAQGYASSHCINAKFIAAIWVIAGVCGFSGMFTVSNALFHGTSFYWQIN